MADPRMASAASAAGAVDEGELLLVSRSRAGHRGAYEDFVLGLFGGRVTRAGLEVFHRSPVFHLMVEEQRWGYFATALERWHGEAILGRLEEALQGLSRGDKTALGNESPFGIGR